MIRKYFHFSSTVVLCLCLVACGYERESLPTDNGTAVFDNEDTDGISLHSIPVSTSLYDDNSLQVIYVKHHLGECEGFEVDHCLIIRRNTNDDWEYFYEKIEGFNYTWGYNYKLVVHYERLETNVADRSVQRYTLIDVLEQSRSDAGQGFKYISRYSGDRIQEITLNRFSTLGRKEFICETDQCSVLRSLMAQNHSVALYLQHGEDSSEPLFLESIYCSDLDSVFNYSCKPEIWAE